jgi:virulence-associated protein VapD
MEKNHHVEVEIVSFLMSSDKNQKKTKRIHSDLRDIIKENGYEWTERGSLSLHCQLIMSSYDFCSTGVGA